MFENIDLIWLLVASFGFITIACLFLYLVLNSIKALTTRKISILIFFSCSIILLGTYPVFYALIWYTTNILFGLLLFYLLTYCVSSFIEKNKSNNLDVKVLPSISVIIVMHNESAVIVKTVQNLLELSYEGNLEIIIIDDSSTDNSVELIEQYRNQIKIIRRGQFENKGKPFAINEIAKQLTTELVCIFDADSLPEKDFLLKAASHFKDEKVALVQCRNIQYNEDTSIISKLSTIDIDAMHYTIIKGKSNLSGMTIFEGRGALLRRTVFLELNGFDCDLPTEDYDYGFRCQIYGYKVIYDPLIINREQSVDNFQDFYYQRYRWLSTPFLAFLKNFKAAMTSPYLTGWQKIDYFLPFTLATWAINLNFIGFLCIIDFMKGYSICNSNYLILFSTMQLCFLLPLLVRKKKIEYILYFPIMFIFYWIVSVIMCIYLEKVCLLKQKKVLKKATHYQSTLSTSIIQNSKTTLS